jgi:hypothetical protein
MPFSIIVSWCKKTINMLSNLNKIKQLIISLIYNYVIKLNDNDNTKYIPYH